MRLDERFVLLISVSGTKGVVTAIFQNHQQRQHSLRNHRPQEPDTLHLPHQTLGGSSKPVGSSSMTSSPLVLVSIHEGQNPNDLEEITMATAFQER